MLYPVLVAAMIVIKPRVRIMYPSNRCHLYTLCALRSPPRSLGAKNCTAPMTVCSMINEYVVKPRMACGERNRLSGRYDLMVSITARDERRAMFAPVLRRKCAHVPRYRSASVWVGCSKSVL